jgi:hypothetical protein
MALPNTYGTDHVFGLLDTSQVFITIQSDGIDQSCGVDVKVLDSTGRVCTVRKDDEQNALTFMGILVPGETIPSAGGVIGFDSEYYIIDTVSNAGENTGFRKVSVKATRYQEVDVTPAPPGA